MHGSHEVIKIGEAQFYVGLHWFFTQSKHYLLDSVSLREVASKEGLHFYGQNKFEGMDGKKSYQYALAPQPKGDDGETIYCGASLLSNFAREVNALPASKTSVFLYTTSGVNSSRIPVWLCAINDTGAIIDGKDVTCPNASKALDVLEELSLIEQLNFIIVDGDENAQNIATTFLSQHSENPKDDVTSINVDSLIGYIEESGSGLKRAYRPLPFKVEKAAVTSVVGGLAIAAYFGITHLSLSGHQKEIEQTSPLISEKMNQYHEMMNEYRPSRYYDDHSFRADTLEQFSKSLQSTLYDPLTISLILREINSNLPMNSAQWELTKISYVNNRFLAFYNRRPNGKGVFFMLDENIQIVNEMTEGIDIRPFSLNDQGNTRVYNIIPQASVARQELINETKDSIALEGRLRTNVGRAIQSAAQHLREMTDYITEYEQIGFLDKWVFRKTSGIANGIRESLHEFDDIEYRLQGIVEEKEAHPPFRLNENFILGNVMDFVTMLQLDSLFQWSYPQLKRTFPSEASLSEKNRSGSDNMYSAAIESYRVEISTQSTEDEGQLRSYGITDMIQLGFLLDKPFVNVEVVEYDRDSEQWRWVINFNRKTSEYNKRFKG